jgi:hypothetical protein
MWILVWGRKAVHTIHNQRHAHAHRDYTAEGLAVEKSEKLFAADVLAAGKKIFEASSLALKLLACHKLRLSVAAREPRTTHACTVSLVQSQG